MLNSINLKHENEECPILFYRVLVTGLNDWAIWNALGQSECTLVMCPEVLAIAVAGDAALRGQHFGFRYAIIIHALCLEVICYWLFSSANR